MLFTIGATLGALAYAMWIRKDTSKNGVGVAEQEYRNRYD